MHYEISVLKRSIGALAVSVAVLFGTGMTEAALGQKGAKAEKHVLKTEHKIEGSAIKSHQKEERVALKTHQRAERRTFKQTWRSRPDFGKNHSARKRCVKECKAAHKIAERACKGKTGADRQACERAANEAHRRCQAGCPR